MKEEQKKLKLEEIKNILKNNNIELNVFGCGCCGSPEVEFKYKGETILEATDDFNIEMITNET